MQRWSTISIATYTEYLGVAGNDNRSLARSHREGIGIVELLDMFPDEETAVKWFEAIRYCGNRNTKPKPGGKPQPYRSPIVMSTSAVRSER